MIKVTRTNFINLEYKIKEIGYNNILKIIPDHEYRETLFVIIYMED